MSKRTNKITYVRVMLQVTKNDYEFFSTYDRLQAVRKGRGLRNR